LEGLATEDVGMFNGHSVYFPANLDILWPFGIFCGRLVYFYPFWFAVPMYQEKSGNPAEIEQKSI
jgi:hypothetical protein